MTIPNTITKVGLHTSSTDYGIIGNAKTVRGAKCVARKHINAVVPRPHTPGYTARVKCYNDQNDVIYEFDL